MLVIYYTDYPVLQKKSVLQISDIQRGDHIMRGDEHWLVDSISGSEFTAYYTSKGKLCKKTKKLQKNMYRVIYPTDIVISPDNALASAEREMGQYNSNSSFDSDDKETCDQFVTRMKCGIPYSIDESCLISHDASPVGCSRITPDTVLVVGDHLLIKKKEQFASVVVCALSKEQNIITILPSIDGQFQIFIGPEDELYRVNYSEQLPPHVIVKRAKSILTELCERQQSDDSKLVTRVILGKEISINPHELIEIQLIKLVTPSHYKCITSLEEIKMGDHLFCPYTGYKWHFMVTECKVGGQKTCFKTIYHLRGYVYERVETLDPQTRNIFKVLYTEQLPTEKAIERARSKLGYNTHGLWKRVEFVPWAKTYFSEGLEIDFMTNVSAPVSKDSIHCFTQLRPGDYLVYEKSKSESYHHYLVLSIESATTCTVVESWNRKSPTEMQITFEGKSFYRINFNSGVCRQAEESVALAKEFCQNGWKISDSYSRQTFINFLKTGDYTNKVNVNSLVDARFKLQREKITSGMQLRKGDHLERRMGYPAKMLPMLSDKKHHMIVSEPVNNEECKVIEAQVKHASVFKGLPAEKSVKLFDNKTEIYRVVYTERIHPEEGISLCLKVCCYYHYY